MRSRTQAQKEIDVAEAERGSGNKNAKWVPAKLGQPPTVVPSFMAWMTQVWERARRSLVSCTSPPATVMGGAKSSKSSARNRPQSDERPETAVLCLCVGERRRRPSVGRCPVDRRVTDVECDDLKWLWGVLSSGRPCTCRLGLWMNGKRWLMVLPSALCFRSRLSVRACRADLETVWSNGPQGILPGTRPYQRSTWESETRLDTLSAVSFPPLLLL